MSTELCDFADAMELGDLERAAGAVDRARTKDAGGFEVLSAAATLALITQRFAEAAEAFEALLPGGPNDQHRSLIENNLAWSYFCLRDDRHRPRADELSQRAFDANPQQPWAKGSRGAVLFWMGNLEAAERLLEDAYFSNSAPSSRAINAACLALLALARSEAPAAQRWAALAPAKLTHLRVEVDQLLTRSGAP